MNKASFKKWAASAAAVVMMPLAIAGYVASGPAQIPTLKSDASVSIPDIATNPGKTVTVNAAVNIPAGDEAFADGYRGFQFDLYQNVPQGETQVFGGDNPLITVTDCKVLVSDWTQAEPTPFDNGYRLLAYAPDGNAPSSQAEIMSITINVGANTPEGTYVVDIKNVNFSSPMGQDIICASENSSFTITVSNEIIPVISLEVEPETLTMTVGDEPYQLEAIVTPDAPTVGGVYWYSDDTDIATVDQQGYVTPVKEGKCNVYARTNGTDANGNQLTDYCEVTVLPKGEENPPEDVDIKAFAKAAGLQYEPGQTIIVESGTNVDMWAETYGENQEGWTFSWTKAGESAVLSTTSSLSVLAVNDSEQPLTVTYVLNAVNTWKGQEIMAAEFTFPIEIWKKGEINGNPGANPEGWYPSADNKVYVSQIRIRERDELGLYVEPIGGYKNQWTYTWYAPDGTELTDTEVIDDGRLIYTPALLYGAAANTGVNQAISENTYTVTATNYGPNGEIWHQETLKSALVYVYKRPQLPTELLRKGDGTPHMGQSQTLVVMMTPLTNQQLVDLGYSYDFGYFNSQDVEYRVPGLEGHDATSLRYCHVLDYNTYWDSSNLFWVYSEWTYADGSVITSGLRFLDGTTDELFNASVFSGTRGELPMGTNGVASVAEDEAAGGIYTVDGKYLGTRVNSLGRGLYIVNGKKVLVRE